MINGEEKALEHATVADVGADTVAVIKKVIVNEHTRCLCRQFCGLTLVCKCLSFDFHCSQAAKLNKQYMRLQGTKLWSISCCKPLSQLH